jgi:predicted kinase
VTLPDVIVIRGAPGSGKSETAKRLAKRLGHGARVEVDTLRSMIVRVEWTDQREHSAVLALAVGVVAGFLRMGHRPVILVDTFSGDKLGKVVNDLSAAHAGVEVRAFSLAPSPAALKARVEGRPDGEYKDLSVCEKLNADVARRLLPEELLIDNSDLTPEESVEVIVRACSPPRT